MQGILGTNTKIPNDKSRQQWVGNKERHSVLLAFGRSTSHPGRLSDWNSHPQLLERLDRVFVDNVLIDGELPLDFGCSARYDEENYEPYKSAVISAVLDYSKTHPFGDNFLEKRLHFCLDRDRYERFSPFPILTISYVWALFRRFRRTPKAWIEVRFHCCTSQVSRT